MVGVFVALDAILFYIFWELSLIPMLYIIARGQRQENLRCGKIFHLHLPRLDVSTRWTRSDELFLSRGYGRVQL